MTTIPHEQPSSLARSGSLDARDLLATVAIVVIWLAVLFVGVFGPDFVGRSIDGNATTIPSATDVEEKQVGAHRGRILAAGGRGGRN